jgi:hypothetical protein
VVVAPQRAVAQDWNKLPEQSRDIAVDGQQVRILVRPEIRFSDAPSGNIVADLRATAGLDDLQDKASALLRRLAEKKSRCETHWSFPELSPAVAQAGKLKISGRVRVEKWICKPFKTRLGQETASFTVALYPVNRTSEIAVKAELEQFDLGNSLLGAVEDELRAMISNELGKAFDGDDLKFKLPPEVSGINPQFTAAEIRDAGGGKGQLFMQAQATIRASEMNKLLSIISKPKEGPPQ